MVGTAVARQKREPDPPAPGAIVRFYPNPLDIIRAYVESDFAQQLATEHERKVRLLAEEGAAVTDADSYKRVGDRLVDVATHRKDVETWFEPITQFAFRLHRMLCDRKNDVLRPLQVYETTAKENRLRLERADARRRQEEEQRLQEQARLEEQERLTREAEALEARGEHALADQVMEQAIAAPTPVFAIASALPATKGISSRENWKWQPLGGDSPQARARALQLVPRDYLELSDKKLTAYAKAHGASARIPGIQFYDAGTVVVR